MKTQSSQSPGGRVANRFRNGMAMLQVALSMALLICAGLFTRSLYNVARVDLGIEVDRLATFAVSPLLNGYRAEESRSLFERLEGGLAALPGVQSVTGSMVPVIAGNNWGTDVRVEGFESGPDVDDNSRFNLVGSGFFRTLGIPLIAGREFEISDELGRPKVAVVNEAFARKFHLGRDAVGKWMSRDADSEVLDVEIVGLVRDSKYSEVKQEIPPVFYVPYRQEEDLGFLNFYLRSAGAAEPLLPSLRGVVARLDPDLPVEDLRTMRLQIRDNVFLDRFLSTLSAAFAILATLLASIGLYGVLAYAVSQRTREIGLRMALGADGAQVRGMILRRVAWLALPGAILGTLAALALGRIGRSLLFELEGTDPGVIAGAALVLLLVAFGSGMIPARRAARIDPMIALREE